MPLENTEYQTILNMISELDKMIKAEEDLNRIKKMYSDIKESLNTFKNNSSLDKYDLESYLYDLNRKLDIIMPSSNLDENKETLQEMFERISEEQAKEIDDNQSELLDSNFDIESSYVGHDFNSCIPRGKTK